MTTAISEQLQIEIPVDALKALPLQINDWKLNFFDVRERLLMAKRKRTFRLTVVEYRRDNGDRVWLEFEVPADPTRARTWYVIEQTNGQQTAILASINVPVEGMVDILNLPPVAQSSASEAQA